MVVALKLGAAGLPEMTAPPSAPYTPLTVVAFSRVKSPGTSLAPAVKSMVAELPGVLPPTLIFVIASLATVVRSTAQVVDQREVVVQRAGRVKPVPFNRS